MQPQTPTQATTQPPSQALTITTDYGFSLSGQLYGQCGALIPRRQRRHHPDLDVLVGVPTAIDGEPVSHRIANPQ